MTFKKALITTAVALTAFGAGVGVYALTSPPTIKASGYAVTPLTGTNPFAAHESGFWATTGPLFVYPDGGVQSLGGGVPVIGSQAAVFIVSNPTWAVPSNASGTVSSICVTGCGSGGSGGSYGTATYGGSGGSSGEWTEDNCIALNQTITKDTTLAITIAPGVAGNVGTAGSNGNITTIIGNQSGVTYLSLAGGLGGLIGASVANGVNGGGALGAAGGTTAGTSGTCQGSICGGSSSGAGGGTTAYAGGNCRQSFGGTVVGARGGGGGAGPGFGGINGSGGTGSTGAAVAAAANSCAGGGGSSNNERGGMSGDGWLMISWVN